MTYRKNNNVIFKVKTNSARDIPRTGRNELDNFGMPLKKDILYTPSFIKSKKKRNAALKVHGLYFISSVSQMY